MSIRVSADSEVWAPRGLLACLPASAFPLGRPAICAGVLCVWTDGAGVRDICRALPYAVVGYHDIS